MQPEVGRSLGTLAMLLEHWASSIMLTVYQCFMALRVMTRHLGFEQRSAISHLPPPKVVLEQSCSNIPLGECFDRHASFETIEQAELPC